MTPGFTTRARAERFATALDAARDVAPLGVDPAWLRVVEQLGSVPDPRPRPEFATALREQLLTAARSEPAVTRLTGAGTTTGTTGATPDPLDRLRLAPSHTRGRRRLTAAVAGLALIGASGGVAVASQDALPGETLYPVKRAIEDVRTGLEDGPSARGTRLAGQARDRLGEVAALTADDGADPVAVEQALQDFASQAREAGDLKLEAFSDSGDEAEVLEVRDLATDAVGALASLETVVPDASRPALLDAAEAALELDSVARQACGGCGGPVVDLVPTLALGPASAGLGDALGLQELEAAARPGDDRGGSTVDGGGTTGGGAAPTAPTTRGGRDDGRTQGAGGPGRGPEGGQGERGGGVSVPVDGGSVPGTDRPLRSLREDVGRTLDGLTGAVGGDAGLDGLTGGPGGGLLGGADGDQGGQGGTGSGSGSGQGAGSGKHGSGSGPTSGTKGGGNGAKDGGSPLGGALQDLDDTLDGLVP